MKPSFENNDKPDNPAPGTVSNASTDSTLVLWDNAPDNNNIVDVNRNFSNTLSMSTNGDLSKTHACTACCCSCEHAKCIQCLGNPQAGLKGFSNVALDLTDDVEIDSLANGYVVDDKNLPDDDFDDREITWNDFDISKFTFAFFCQ